MGDHQMTGAVMESVACPFACNEGDARVLSGSDRLHGVPGTFSVVICKGCGLMRTDPRPVPSAMAQYYPDDYGPYAGTMVNLTDSSAQRSAIKSLLKPYVRRAFDTRSTSVPKLAPGRMLEIGCACGAFLHEMSSEAWQVEGIEFSPVAARAASSLGFPVHCTTLENAQLPEGTFDLITGWMVLEHLHDPILGLKKLRSWAKPGAWLAISVPNAASLEFSLFAERWYALQVPTHLWHFTPDTLKKMLFASGWRVEAIHHQRSLTNLMISAGYLLRDKGLDGFGQSFVDYPTRGGLWFYGLFPIAWLLSVFGQTGRMTVWARAENEGV